MARSKSNSIRVKLDEPSPSPSPPPPPPKARKRATAVAKLEDAAESKKTKGRKHNANTENYGEDSFASVAHSSKTADKAAEKVQGNTIRAKRAAKKGLDRELDQARHAVDEISNTFASATPSWPLPGALSPSVDTVRAMRVIVPAAIASGALSAVGHLILAEVASSSPSSTTWTSWTSFIQATSAPGIWSPFVALALRLLKLTLAWGSLADLAAVNILSYAPIVFLLSSFYNVPLPTALLSLGLSFTTDILPLAAWRLLSNEVEADYDEAAPVVTEKDLLDDLRRDPSAWALSSIYAGVLYNFIFAQACRFFLPTALVLHFLGIPTVEPARALSLDPSSFTQYELCRAIFHSGPAVILNFVCAAAASTFIFGQAAAAATHGAVVNKRLIALRTLALSVVVGAGVFAQCFIGIRGVDTVGAAAFASIWAGAPLVVGAALGYAGVSELSYSRI